MSESEQGGAGRREVAYRIFAAEYDDADFSYSESDEERAPNYVVTPSGARINRLFVVGVLTEIEQVNEDVLRARVVDPTGAFVVYAGQYQPDELAFLERADPPAFVAVTGKARTFQPEDGETVYTSVRPESINEVDAETRDRWVVQTAEQTLHRVAAMAEALGREERGDDLRDALVAGGVDEGLAAGVALALEHYGTTPTYLDALRETALDAARVVAGERDEVDPLTAAPDAEGATTLADLAALESPLGDAEVAADETTGQEATDTETGAETSEPADATATPGGATETTGSEETAPGAEPTSGTPSETASPDTEPGIAETGSEVSDAATAEAGGSGTTESETETGAGTDDDIGDFEGGEFEIEDEERERIEEEYGTDFSTGTEVDEPGEADIETPDPEDPESEGTESAGPADATEPESDPAGADETETVASEAGMTEPEAAEPEEADAESEAEITEPQTDVETETEDAEAGGSAADETDAEAPSAEDVDLTDAVMEAMRELDDGDGADHEAVVERVVEQYGADADAVEEAVQDALMDGRCYEPDESTLKPI